MLVLKRDGVGDMGLISKVAVEEENVSDVFLCRKLREQNFRSFRDTLQLKELAPFVDAVASSLPLGIRGTLPAACAPRASSISLSADSISWIFFS